MALHADCSGPPNNTVWVRRPLTCAIGATSPSRVIAWWATERSHLDELAQLPAKEQFEAGSRRKFEAGTSNFPPAANLRFSSAN